MTQRNTEPIEIPAQPPENRPRLHLQFVDGIRALAALFVMLGHAWFQPSNGYYELGIMNRLGLSYGHIAVDVFIVVSGFCLMLPIAHNGGTMRSIRSFFTRRARRILPPYYAALFLSCLFILLVASEKTGTVWDSSLPLTWPQFLAHLLLIHDLPLGWEGGGINYPLWSIAVEWQIYFFMPLFVVSFRRLGSALTVAVAVLVGLTTHVAAGWLDGAHPWYLGLFAMGCAAAVYGSRALSRRLVAWCRALCLLGWAVPALLIVWGGNSFFKQNVAYLGTLIGVATALTLLVMFREVSDGRPSVLTRLVSWGPLVRIGLFSYSLYLVHAPLLHLLDRIFTATIGPRPEQMFVLLLATSPLIVGASYLFFLAFEKPFMTQAGTQSASEPPRRTAGARSQLGLRSPVREAQRGAQSL
jgi:peptidoglycan/LPS O-acetylase OafA/YrhL